MNASQYNTLVRLVNMKIPKEMAGELTESEGAWYDSLWEEAVAHEKKYGFWPVFELDEIEWEDPVLDIYNSTPEEMRDK